MKQARLILRNAYDGNYENAIKLLVEVIEEQDDLLEEQKSKIERLTDQVKVLQKSISKLNENTNWVKPTWMD